MEIISFLDDTQTSYTPNFKLMKFRRNLNNMSNYSSLSTSVYVPFIEERGNFLNDISKAFQSISWYLKHKLKYLLLILFMGCIGVFTTYGIFTLVEMARSIAKPVEFAYLSPSEIEVLDEAMERFTLVLSDEIDASGNILGNDEFSISDVKLSEPVKFTNYTVKSGDTISGISKKFGLKNISTLIAINNIDNVRQLRSGQKLLIPSVDGIPYTVQSNDTLAGLSVRHGIAVEDILDVNDLASAELIIGQKLFIPGGKLDSATLKKAMGELFIYPIAGKYRLTSKFGRRADPFTGIASSHTGIDLAISQGTPIKATMSGKIIAVGYTNVYGNYVIIDHENGYQTLYAHMQKPSPLKKGQRVAQGKQIGLVGNTGYSTGPHLHFTVYKNGKLIDPLSVLK